MLMRGVASALLVLSSAAGIPAQSVRAVAVPDEAPLVTTDLVHFAALLDALPHARDTTAAIQRLYLDPATPGLRAYAANFDIDAATLARALRERPRFYASLRSAADRVARVEPRIREALRGWEAIFPDAIYPPVYFFVGIQRAGGLAREVGLLISADMYVAEPGAPLEEVRRPESIRPPDELPHIVAHELAHYQQFTIQGLDRYRALYRSGTTLLGLAIREGSADFLADLASGSHINPAAHAYGASREADLWALFRTEMWGGETGEWMFRAPSNGEWPQDLGYYLGYRITEAFYRRAADPLRAVREILAVTDFERFLARSGYPDL